MSDENTLSILIDIRSRLEEMDKTVESMKGLGKEMKDTQEKATGLATLFKQGLMIDATRRGMDLLKNSMREFVLGAFSMAGQIKTNSSNLGMSAEAYQVLSEAMRDVGADQSKLTEIVNTNNRSLIDARNITSTAAAAYRELGLSAAEMEGLTVERRFEAIGKAVISATDQTKAFGAAGSLVGTRQLPALLTMLKKLGGEGYDQLASRVSESGQIMSDDTIDRLDKAKRALEDLKKRATIAVGEAISEITEGNDASGVGDMVESGSKAWQWVVGA